MAGFSREALEHFAQLSREIADGKVSAMYPDVTTRDARDAWWRIFDTEYRRYITPPGR